MHTIRVYSRATGKLIISFTDTMESAGGTAEKQLKEWLNGRSESDFTIAR